MSISGIFMVGDNKEKNMRKFQRINGFLRLQLEMRIELGLRLRLTNINENRHVKMFSW